VAIEIIIHWIINIALIALLVIFITDGLTFLWVRRVYQIAYSYVIKTHPHKIIMIDVDDFKDFNTRRGHRFGDTVLKRIGTIILKESHFRGFRYGGEELVVLLPWTNEKRAFALAERIRQKVSEIDLKKEKITISVGIGDFEQQADEALYLAKGNGKNCTVIKKPG